MHSKSYKRFIFRQTRSGILSVVAMIFFISCSISGAQGPQQKEQQKFYDDLFSVSFPTEKDGWACGRWGTVLHTEDGGKTWIRQNSGTDYTLSSISFVDSKIGWAVGDEGIIIHTEDGGMTWQKQKSPVPFFLMKVYFVTSLKGWIVTEGTHILNTNDGGQTWKIQFKDEDYILQAVSFCDELNGWAVGEYGYIYHTRDGGATWKKEAGFFKISDETGKVEGGDFLFDVVAIDPQTAWAVGIDSYVVKTLDGGKTWKEVTTGAPKTHLFCVVFNRDTIVVGGSGIFLISTDRGQSWQPPRFEPPATYGWIYGIARRGDAGFAVVGWEGAIYLSGSKTWRRVVY
jgi:photosystem II stability/assembly factor-like uncharacterized protein